MSADALEGKRILSVDDSATIRKYLHNILVPFGIAVKEAATGEAALSMLKSSEDFDMVLLDLQLPDMDGMEVLERLRKEDQTTTVVVLTGTGDIRSASAAVKAGADGYIEKHHLPKMDRLDDLFYALEQSLDHRAGIVAQAQLEAVKADFYSMVTHDLRNPTGAIILSLDMLMSGALGPLLPKQKEFLSIAQTASEKLLALINDYLDFSQIDSGYLRLDKSDTELRGIVEETVKMAELQAEAKAQTLTVELPVDPLPAHIDGKRL